MKTLSALLLLCVQEPKADEEARIRAALDRLGQAMAERDEKGILEQFDVQRMTKEFQAQLAAEAPRIAEHLTASLPRLVLGAAGPGSAWEKIRTLGVRVRPGGQEAEALCRATVGGEKSKVRFWLARDGDAWKVYDIEFPELAFRLSVFVGLLAPAAGEGAASRKALLRGLQAVKQAVIQAASGDVEEAHLSLEEARKLDLPAPLPALIDLLRSGVLLALGKNEDSLAAADAALKRQKDLHLAHHMRGAALAELERYEEAIAAHREYLRLAGDDPDAWLAIGDAYERLENAGEAIEAYRKGAACDDEDHENRLNLGRLLVEEGKAGEAAKFLLEASKNAPEDEDVFEEAADLLSGAGEHAAVLRLAEERIARAPGEAIPLLWKGRALRKLGRAEEAVKALRAAYEKDSENDGVLEGLAVALADAGKHDEAFQLAEAYGARNADEPETARLLAHVHARAGRAKDAVRELRAYLADEYDGHADVAAEPAFKEILATDEGRALLERAKAKSEYMTRVAEIEDWKEEEENSRRFLERYGDDPDGWYTLGSALRRQGKHADAEAALRKGMPYEKDPGRFRDELARAMAAQGKVDEALEVAEKVTGEAGLHLRAVVTAIAGRTEEAVRALKKLLEAEPDWHSVVDEDEDLKELRKLPAVQELLRRAKGEE